MEDNNARNASDTAVRSSSSMSPSETLTNGFKMLVNRLLNALPATVTKDARARALNTVMGIAVSVGINTGKTVVART